MKYIVAFFIFTSLFFSCKKDMRENSNCTAGDNSDIYHTCLDFKIESTGNKGIDFNNDGKFEFAVELEKDLHNGITINSIGYMPLVNVTYGSAGGLRFDYYAEKLSIYGDSFYFPISIEEGFQVDSSIYNWLLRLSLNEPNVVLHSWADLTSLGQNLQFSKGLVDKGDIYIAFRFYDFDAILGPQGWKNGWIKLNITPDRVILYELAIHRKPETMIKVGEK